ncbi:hypothetical protein NKH18_30080 [Streptomyces sp. M10(2022)]
MIAPPPPQRPPQGADWETAWRSGADLRSSPARRPPGVLAGAGRRSGAAARCEGADRPGAAPQGGTGAAAAHADPATGWCARRPG